MPTQPGSRVSTMKQQAGHGFARGQPLVYSGGRYQLASSATGFNGVCGSIPDVNRFELVTAGELDGLFGLATETTLFLSITPGVLATAGTAAVLRATTSTSAFVLPAQIAGTAASDAAIASAIADHVAAANPHPQYLQSSDIDSAVSAAVAGLPADSRYVRTTPAAVLDIDVGELVWDIDNQEQVLDLLYV
jgi:hypothetical protein